MKPLLLVATLMGLALVGNASEPAALDTTGMHGFWKPESIVFNGKEQCPDAAARDLITLVIKNNEYRLFLCKDKKKDLHLRLATATLKLNSQDRTLELNIIDGERKGLECHGIYKIEGGKLHFCYGPKDQPRPTKFESAPQSLILSEVWVREKSQ